MRLVIWNVNSIRTRVDRVIAFLERSDTNVLAMQEIKCRPDQFPMEAFEEADYHVTIRGLNQRNGVAVAPRPPILDAQDHFPTQPALGEPSVVETRTLDVTTDTTNTLPSEDRQTSSITIWSLYVSNGRELTHAHHAYKLGRLVNLAEQGRGQLTDSSAPIAPVGDWNIAPLDENMWDMNALEGVTRVSTPEREASAALVADGWVEATRERITNYTYWDYQKLRFPKSEGMRIDFAYCSPALAAHVSDTQIDHGKRKGKRASDHVPVIVGVD